LVILSLIYFRNVIFLPNINHYVDAAQAYIEKQLSVSIPVYVNKNIKIDTIDNQAKAVDVKADLCNSEVSTESAVDNEPVDSVEPDKVIAVAVDSVEIEITEPQLDVKSPEVVETKEVVTESVETKANFDLLTQLSQAVNSLNNKVDKLYEAGQASVDSALQSYEKQQDQVTVEAARSSVNEVTKQKDDEKNIYLTEDAKQMFYMARQTYWMGDSLGAEKMYLKLADVDNDNPDIYGELGNVYYSQGKWNEAGKAYYEAAIRLLDLDRVNQVNYLLRVIQGLDSESAEKLKQKMSS